MRKSTLFVAILAMATIAVSSAFGQLATRVDYNGEMVNATPVGTGALSTSGAVPYGWSAYSTGAGGGLASTYQVNNVTSQWNFRQEYEDGIPNPPGTAAYPYPGGHSVLTGQTGVGSGTYGYEQTIVSTAGKHYWMIGSFRKMGSTFNANQGFSVGLNNGSGTGGAGGMLIQGGNGDYNGNSNLGGTSFTHGLVAGGSSITAHFGMWNNTGVQQPNQNTFFDGIRVWERDIPVYSGLQNGNFQGAVQDASRWNDNMPSDLNAQSTGSWRPDAMLDGWLPMGGHMGQISQVKQGINGGGSNYGGNPAANNLHPGSTNSLFVDQYKAYGRQYFMQHVKIPADPKYADGVGLPYTLTADVFAFTPTGTTINGATPMIGIDPTGGNDPNSASIIWSAPGVADSLWHTLSVSANATGANGITVWLSGGYNGQVSTSLNRAPGTSGFAFDELILTPEPATVGFLALGSLLLLRRRRA